MRKNLGEHQFYKFWQLNLFPFSLPVDSALFLCVLRVFTDGVM